MRLEMRNSLFFTLTSVGDVSTKPARLEDNEPVPGGTVYKCWINPGAVLAGSSMREGQRQDMIDFAQHFREWKYFGSRFIIQPVAHGAVDPAHISEDPTQAGMISAYDLSLWSAYKRWGYDVQQLPSEYDSRVYDNAYLLDPDWKKCSVTRSFSIYCRPSGATLSMSAGVASKLTFDELNHNKQRQNAAPNEENSSLVDIYAFTQGRRRTLSGWWPTRTWQTDEEHIANMIWSPEYPMFLWRLPHHWKKKLYFKIWEFHRFGLRRPVFHDAWNPQSMQFEPVHPRAFSAFASSLERAGLGDCITNVTVPNFEAEEADLALEEE